MGQQSFLPEIDRKRTQAAVEAALEKYRIYKYLSVEEREASTTAAYSDMPRSSPTNVTSDQTANIAIHNVDSQAFRKEYCERVERAVKRMPRLERFLIEERYMTTEHDYITDQRVYSFVFQPPISEPTYSKIRWRAFYKLASYLNLMITKNNKND
ncbi:ArpU family phage packaging/lysis transcriptional regulator [Paenibacillus kribbensis]|uniref:ArpU family phage packaging/lysis transcriptional regulator n=1 Tax=Paenibacillus kribbensis TaxID=172713 RepID=UPI002DBB1F44|nr:ArpU family phage packaging/lysis transcriptional regulator [Paenibacillus kribbensis]MEC0237815.1 ArpU family phage packaging/lysis transcriptional regulator [Paenibacillus kribbensis]